MKNLLIAFIGIFVFIGCGKSSEGPEPVDAITPEDLVKDQSIMNVFDISPNDTAGLRLFGRSIIEEQGNAILGNKNGHLWIQLLENTANDVYKRKNNFIVNANFNDKIELDLGYGEKKIINVNYITWTDPISSFADMWYTILWHDQEHFILSRSTEFSWVICKDEIFEKQTYYREIFSSGYIGRFSNDTDYVCNEKGEPLYKFNGNCGSNFFIDMYEYIKYSSDKISRENAETGKIIWETQFEKMGQVMDGHEPKIGISIEIKDNVIFCTFNITNYDGSKETKIINLDIETGEVIKL